MAALGVPVICQKPMAPTLAAAERMVSACRVCRCAFFRARELALADSHTGAEAGPERRRDRRAFRGWITMISGFPVFSNQPSLRDAGRFILSDLGSHLFDVARFLFGEATNLYCQAGRVHQDIKGEDVATVMMRTAAGMTVVVVMGYAENHLEHDWFPETHIFVEGAKGSIELGSHYWIRVTTETGTHSKRYRPSSYRWIDPAYAVVQSSMVPCLSDLLRALQGQGFAETTGEDNLKTVRLVSAAYESAANGCAVRFW